jgi:alpha-beta hydrolase superfamily lysophospholipase
MGGAAVLRAVADEDVRPAAVILESPFDRLLSTVKNRFSAMGLPSVPGAELLVFWGGVQHGYSGFAHNPVDYARRVTCPVLLLHGAADPRVTPRQARAVFDNLAGPKQFVTFENGGHEATLASDAKQWKTRVGEFLQQRAPPRDCRAASAREVGL